MYDHKVFSGAIEIEKAIYDCTVYKFADSLEFKIFIKPKNEFLANVLEHTLAINHKNNKETKCIFYTPKKLCFQVVLTNFKKVNFHDGPVIAAIAQYVPSIAIEKDEVADESAQNQTEEKNEDIDWNSFVNRKLDL